MTARLELPGEERRLLRDLLAVGTRTRFGRCHYCGQRCYGLACRTHRDLLAIDPNYVEARRR